MNKEDSVEFGSKKTRKACCQQNSESFCYLSHNIDPVLVPPVLFNALPEQLDKKSLDRKAFPDYFVFPEMYTLRTSGELVKSDIVHYRADEKCKDANKSVQIVAVKK